MSLRDRLNQKVAEMSTSPQTGLNVRLLRVPVEVKVSELMDAAAKCNTDTAKHLLAALETNYQTPERRNEMVVTDKATVEALLNNVEVVTVRNAEGQLLSECCPPEPSSLSDDNPLFGG